MSTLKIAYRSGRKAPPGINGFTLLEVMVSISIISIVFVTLFKMQSGTVDLAAASKFQTMAPGLANKVLATLEDDLLDEAESRGDFEKPFQEIRWQTRVSDVPLADILDFLGPQTEDRFKKVEVMIAGPKEDQTYTLTTWRQIRE